MAVVREPRTRERLSREVIVTGALGLADREGIDAVTIRRVANDNSVTPMALYWHFSDKDALFDGIAERIYSEVRMPEPTELQWDDQLRGVLIALLDALRLHPLVAETVPSRIMRSKPGLDIA